ncbi:MAG: DUF2157 domain-containing protein [Hydrogenophaga sp.]|uniref:DUF2157 domain-containing protein n=1 Tax=Hydrogenophaga sp. TaxID=1904254 RepID=UPI002735562C|nr:DUF2157 domain-containing protein [Hydrogenophaga sp.]MDP3626311.1 DUF2157 domain-containing protein [Hydrogenophaga sp.]
MSHRLALYQLAQQHKLDAQATAQLMALGGQTGEPPAAARRVWQALALLAAALVGLGLVVWVAANWDELGRAGRFWLLQGVVVAMGLGAGLRPALRAPLGLLTLLAVGALFAYFGQTYQTGADAWQLFALWAALTLPLALGTRHDVVWAAWALVAAVGVSLWVQTHTGHQWRVLPDDLRVHALGWAGLGLLCLLLSPAWANWTGAGPWARRTALTLTTVALTVTALGGLFGKDIAPHYPLGLVLLVGASAWLSRPAHFEVFGLSAAAMGLNALVVGGLARLLFDRGGGDAIGRLMLIGLVSAGLLALSVKWILRLVREAAERENGA